MPPGRAPLVLATSSPPDRPWYRRDFLSCLASPEGHVVSFSYRKRWFDPAVLARGSALKGRAAVIVFCSRPHPDEPVRYLPLRHVAIRALRPQEAVDNDLVTDDTHIAVDFTLGPYVNVADTTLKDLEEQWQQWIGNATELPPAPSIDSARWVFEADNFPEGEPLEDQLTPWQTLSTRLARFPALADSYFFRVASVEGRTSGRGGRQVAVEPGSTPPRYALRTLDEYTIGLDAYSQGGKSFSDVLDVRTSDLLTATEPVTSTVGQATQLQIFVRTGAVQAAQTAVVVLRGSEGCEDEAPRVALVARVKPRRLLVVVLLLLVAVGVAMAGFNWKTDAGLPATASIALKIVGALIVSVALFFASRSAPGVSK